LTKRKLIPALFHLFKACLLPDSFAVLGLDRLDLDDDSFLDLIAEHIRDHVGIAFDQSVWEPLVERLHYMKIDMLEGADYERLRERLSEIDTQRGTEGNYLFYRMIPPSLLPRVTNHLDEAGLLRETENDWRRVVVEKPFGWDLESTVALNRKLHRNMDEEQIYRIDHYLGKETVQNIMVFRFANGFIELLEPPSYRPCAAHGGRIRRRRAPGALLRGGGGRSPIPYRDPCCTQAHHRQLALGQCALLSAHRQAICGPVHGDRDPVQEGTDDPVQAHGRGASQPQHAGTTHPTRRGHPNELRRQGAQSDHGGRHREHGLLLRGLLRQQAGDRPRDPDLRLAL